MKRRDLQIVVCALYAKEGMAILIGLVPWGFVRALPNCTFQRAIHILLPSLVGRARLDLLGTLARLDGFLPVIKFCCLGAATSVLSTNCPPMAM